MNLQDDDFRLFGLKQQFAQERSAIDARWKELQREVHPDKFAAHGAASQRIAMQWSVRINEAHQRLKDPLKRAAYLCELAGFPVNAENNTAMPTAFLMQQMELRESLEDASSLADLDDIDTLAASSQRDMLRNCEQFLDADKDYASAVGQVRALMFLDKFRQDLGARMEQMEAQGQRQ